MNQLSIYLFCALPDKFQKYICNDYVHIDIPFSGYVIKIVTFSNGFKPLFHSYKKCKTVNDLEKICKSGVFNIIDQYGNITTWNNFKQYVDFVQNSQLKSNTIVYDEAIYSDPDGYEFMKGSIDE